MGMVNFFSLASVSIKNLWKFLVFLVPGFANTPQFETSVVGFSVESINKQLRK